MPVSGIASEQLEHPVVIDGPPRKGPADQRRQMEVSDRDRIGVTPRPLRHFGRRPLADTGYGAQSAQPLVSRQRQALVEPVRDLRRGDVVAFPVGPDGAHQVTGPGTILVFSSKTPLEVIEYPDSGKVAASPPRLVFRAADAVDYWEGE